MGLDALDLNNLITGVAAWGAVFMAALWLSLIIWTARDIRARAKNTTVRILAPVLVALLFLPGVVIYLILRPPRTLEEQYQQVLEEDALLKTVEDLALCPGCNRQVKDNWMVCPSCHVELKKVCHNCHKLMELSWSLCPYCATPVPGMRRENITLEDALTPTREVEEPPPDETISLDELLNKNGAL